MHPIDVQDDEAEPIGDVEAAEQDNRGDQPIEDAESPAEGVEECEEEAKEQDDEVSLDCTLGDSDSDDHDSVLSKKTLELGEERSPSPSSEPKDIRAYLLDSPIPGKSDRLNDLETHAFCMDLMKHFRDTDSPILTEPLYREYIKHCEWSLRKFGERALTWLIKRHHFNFWQMHFKSQPLDEDRGSQKWFYYVLFLLIKT